MVVFSCVNGRSDVHEAAARHIAGLPGKGYPTQGVAKQRAAAIWTGVIVFGFYCIVCERHPGSKLYSSRADPMDLAEMI